MPDKLPEQDALASWARDSVAKRRAGQNAQCECGETRIRALNTKRKPIRCFRCIRKSKGQTTNDRHHIAGKSNSPVTAPVPVNDHRAELSPAQYDWPRRTLENPDRSPLLAAAACIRGFRDYVVYLIDRVLLWIPDMLEKAE